MININKFEITERMKCSADTKLFFNDVYTNSARTKKAQVKTVQSGRSMIEMLGVLAIVGVLSVGGITGYSKAMLKYKSNKQITQINNIVQVLINHSYSLGESYENGSINLRPVLEAMNEVPEEMIKPNVSEYLYDALGSKLEVSATQENQRLRYQSLKIYTSNGDNALESCRNLLKIAKNYHKYVFLVRSHGGGNDYYGDTECGVLKCIKDITLPEIENLCRVRETHTIFILFNKKIL